MRDGWFETLGFVHRTQERMLVFAESERFVRAVCANPNISAVVTTPQWAGSFPGTVAVGVSEHPKLAFAAIHNHLAQSGFYWRDFPTVIAEGARVDPRAFIAEKNVRIGAGTIVQPNATVLERCILGAGVVVGAGCVLGGTGFQTARGAGALIEFEHAGSLIVEDRVRLLPGAVVATGLFRESTTLGYDARIGSQAFVSHAVQVGARSFIGHGAVINGNVRIGAGSWIGPGAVVSQELEIGEESRISLGAVVIRSLPPNSHVSGNFAVEHRRLLRFLAHLDAN
jgi:UDP-3-O-[3-hydroxymyristoyl] glucosamine N-acyltransferase